MLHTKRLAHRETEIRKPEMTKRLFFTALCGTALMAMVSCAHADAISRFDNAAPKRNAPAWVPDKPKKEGPRGKCGADLSRTLGEGEKYVESKCTDSYEFVLTSEKLRVFPKQKPESRQEGGVSVSFSNMSIETKGLLQAGVVDWEATDSSCYFLLKDRTLVFIPMAEEDRMVYRYVMQFDVSGMGKDTMVSFSGRILLADPRGYIISLPDAVDADWSRLDLGQPENALKLVVRGGKLFAGSGSAPETEIKIGKDGPELSGP